MTRHKLSLLWKPDEQPEVTLTLTLTLTTDPNPDPDPNPNQALGAHTPAPAPATARAARRRGQASAQDRPPHGGGLSLSARAPFTVKPTAASSVRALQARTLQKANPNPNP